MHNFCCPHCTDGGYLYQRWKFKWPGRVGDSPIIGSGLYCDGQVGAAVATGDGEEVGTVLFVGKSRQNVMVTLSDVPITLQIMRVCLSFLVVEYMRNGKNVQEACRLAISRLQQIPRPQGKQTMHSTLTVGVVAMDVHGNIGAASTIDASNPHRGTPYFPVSYWREGDTDEPQILEASIDGAMI